MGREFAALLHKKEGLKRTSTYDILFKTKRELCNHMWTDNSNIAAGSGTIRWIAN